MPPNLLAHYFYLWETTVVWQAIETAWISASSGGRSSSYWCQQRQVFYNAGTTPATIVAALGDAGYYIAVREDVGSQLFDKLTPDKRPQDLYGDGRDWTF